MEELNKVIFHIHNNLLFNLLTGRARLNDDWRLRFSPAIAGVRRVSWHLIIDDFERRFLNEFTSTSFSLFHFSFAGSERATLEKCQKNVQEEKKKLGRKKEKWKFLRSRGGKERRIVAVADLSSSFHFFVAPHPPPQWNRQRWRLQLLMKTNDFSRLFLLQLLSLSFRCRRLWWKISLSFFSWRKMIMKNGR